MIRSISTWLSGLILAAFAGCAPTGVQLSVDFCDGVDNDADGAIDEGRGPEIGCEVDEVCVGALCQYDCGDAACTASTGETCAVCPIDCGVCPRCGDGTCNGAESCTSCPADCGVCPRCGDGACNGGESCATCRDDCGLCARECTTCVTDGDCGSGQTCLLRLCDGARGCYRAGATCPTISGEACPEIAAYDVCTTDAQCGPRMSCQGGRCTRQGSGACTGDCPPAPNGYPGLRAECNEVTECGTICVATGFQCVLDCTTTCPYGLTCQPSGSGSQCRPPP